MTYLGPLPGMLWCSVKSKYFSERGGPRNELGLCRICQEVACESSDAEAIAAAAAGTEEVNDNFQPIPGAINDSTSVLTPATVGSHPADSRIIESLIAVSREELMMRESDDTSCAICMMSLLPGLSSRNRSEDSEQDTVTTTTDQDLDPVQLPNLQCRHIFHRECISRWLETKGHCPSCRAPADGALLVAAQAAAAAGSSSSSGPGPNHNDTNGAGFTFNRSSSRDRTPRRENDGKGDGRGDSGKTGGKKGDGKGGGKKGTAEGKFAKGKKKGARSGKD